MSLYLISTLGLLLCVAPSVLHTVELVSPMLSRWVVNAVLPFFGPGLPSTGVALTYDEQITMLDAARAAGPEGKEERVDDYLFVTLFEQRQGGIAFLSITVGVLYALGLPVEARVPLHLPLAVMSILFALVNANHAGVSFLGHHPKVSRHGKHVGLVFTPFWAGAFVLNVLAFTGVGA